MVTLNRAVAVAMVHGPAAGLDLLDDAGRRQAHGRPPPLLAPRAHLLELLGDGRPPPTDYREAARRTTSAPERLISPSRTKLELNREGRPTPAMRPVA